MFCSDFFCCCCFTTIQSAFYIPQKNALRTVSEDLSSSSVSLWVLLKLSLSVCKHKLLADLLLLKFPQIAGELFSFIAIPWNHCWDLLLCRLSQISFCTKQTKGTNKKKMPQMLLLSSSLWITLNVFSFVFLYSLSLSMSFRKVTLFLLYTCMSQTGHNLGLLFFWRLLVKNKINPLLLSTEIDRTVDLGFEEGKL